MLLWTDDEISIGAPHREVAERLHEPARSHIVTEQDRACKRDTLASGRGLKHQMRKGEVQAARHIDASFAHAGKPSRPINLIGMNCRPLIVQQDMMRQIRRSAKISLREHFRTADGKEILMQEQFPVQAVLDPERVADSDIDLFASEIDRERGCLQANVEPWKPLGKPAKTRNEPTRNERWPGANRQSVGVAMPLQIGGRIGELVEQRLDLFKIVASHFRYRNATRQPFEQFDAKPIFQHLHQPPHRIGRYVELGARGLEAASTRGRFERPHGVERRQLTAIASPHFC